MNAYDEIYLERARTTLAGMLDSAVNMFGFDLTDFWDKFLRSRIASSFEAGNPSVVAGRSCIELIYEIEGTDELNLPVYWYRADRSPEYWAGWALAYYQWSSVYSFSEINNAVPVDAVVKMYFPYHEMDIRQFCDRMNELMQLKNPYSRLTVQRKKAGITQKELAERSGVPLRTVQQYEQRRKNINAARADYVISMAKVLHCTSASLLECGN